jgi:DNA-binding PadR family transcriptional regulator
MYSPAVPPSATAALSKDLVAASATSLILAILAEGDSYGYAILKRVSEVSGGHLQWTDGMLYPVLHRLERLGHVRARWAQSESGRRRRYYRISTQGREQLSEQKRQWEIVHAALQGIWSTVPRNRTATFVPAVQKG